ncbi:MAG TPA: hypothetical protein VIP11_03215 [Gemmatimonadaceae bacterium]
MNIRALFAAAPCLTVAALGCVRTAPAPSAGYWVSSDSSHYSPVVRLRVTAAARGNQLYLLVDSGSLAVPGPFTPDSPIVLTKLYLTAYLATSNRGPLALATADSVRFADRRGWRASAASDSVLLADYLRFGERRPVHRTEIRMPLPSAEPGTWLVFRLSAKVVDRWLPFDPRSAALTVGRPGGDIRVYACSDRDLAGRVDSARANGLRRSYGALC